MIRGRPPDNIIALAAFQERDDQRRLSTEDAAALDSPPNTAIGCGSTMTSAVVRRDRAMLAIERTAWSSRGRVSCVRE